MIFFYYYYYLMTSHTQSRLSLLHFFLEDSQHFLPCVAIYLSYSVLWEISPTSFNKHFNANYSDWPHQSHIFSFIPFCLPPFPSFLLSILFHFFFTSSYFLHSVPFFSYPLFLFFFFIFLLLSSLSFLPPSLFLPS